MVHEDTINMIEFNPRTSGVAGMANKISQKMVLHKLISMYQSYLAINQKKI